MAREHGPALDVMQAIKQTLDPNGILNPGKIFTPVQNVKR
jgi:D-lactate dehydrogenase (cytochrome)